MKRIIVDAHDGEVVYLSVFNPEPFTEGTDDVPALVVLD